MISGTMILQQMNGLGRAAVAVLILQLFMVLKECPMLITIPLLTGVMLDGLMTPVNSGFSVVRTHQVLVTYLIHFGNLYQDAALAPSLRKLLSTQRTQESARNSAPISLINPLTIQSHGFGNSPAV